ncbi:choline dehydrogenase [Diaporthe amygdali]|uniref:choline dehydrogenase n=1 Tax=Phomopsis amygdali TaxID=1214568 RepID=UPI0022FEB052|nr:choline dehydrogenase [Diaporthe amygdali]KAJ0117444.1 choline dehydrogenase [Diaporthe amygdali]
MASLKILLLLQAVLLSVNHATAKPISLIKRQSVEDEYDFVICGGGTAGLVLANRLTESGNQRVLVLEAGGKAGGGSSSTNGLYYARGSASVYDEWVALGNPGWGWDDVYPLFVKSTHLNKPEDAVYAQANGFDQTFQTYEADAYGDGPLQLSYQGYVPDSNVGFMRALEAINVSIVNELNTGNPTGVKQGLGTLDNRLRRSSSFDSFYRQAQNRSNLDVLFNAPVSELVMDTEGDTPTATGVVFVDQSTGLIHQVNASKEVILSMGAFHSPQMLMLSGIGPASELDAFGITPLVVNENVGRNLNDHSVFSIMATARPESSTTEMAATVQNLQNAQAQYFQNLSGPYTAPSGITNGFLKFSEDELEALNLTEIITRNLASQNHIEFLYESVWYPWIPTPFYAPRDNESYISLTASSMVQLSRGNVSLRSSSMSDPPVINPNYYTEDTGTDRAVAIESFRDLRRILADPELSQYTVGPNNGEVSPGVENVSDDDEDAIFEYVKANTFPNWHASGTVQMLPLEDGGVVDPRLRVYGVDSLRVIDCSVMPILPDVNILASVYMIAEKGSELIREDWDD